MAIDEFLDEAKFADKSQKDIDFIKRLIKSTGFSKTKIAQLVGVDEEFVSEVIILIGNNRFTMGLEYYLLEEAKKEGKHEEAIAIATAMKKGCIPNEQIAKFTRLSVQEIEKL